MKATDSDSTAVVQTSFFARHKRSLVAFASVLTLVTVLFGVFWYLQNRWDNPLIGVDVTELSSVSIRNVVDQTEYELEEQLWSRTLMNFDSPHVLFNTNNFLELAVIEFGFRNGEKIRVSVHDSGKQPGCFRIGPVYFTGGDERMIIRMMDDCRIRELEKRNR